MVGVRYDNERGKGTWHFLVFCFGVAPVLSPSARQACSYRVKSTEGSKVLSNHTPDLFCPFACADFSLVWWEGGVRAGPKECSVCLLQHGPAEWRVTWPHS